MAKRITEHRVRNWAIGGSSGGVVTILLLFAFLSSLGAIEVTGYSEDIICAGTLEDPCYAYINFTAKEDIFIYPSENWSEAIFETDKSVNSVKMFRSWGTGWREIKLNQVCTGTWCGAGTYDAKYSFAFREGRNYSIKYEVIKDSPYDKIKWSFGPIDPLFDSVADIELLSESNSLTHGEAVVKIIPKANYALEGSNVNTWVNKITPAKDLTKYEMSIGENMSYQDPIWIKDIVCNPWNETVANGTNETIIEHSNCIDNGYTDYITRYKIIYLPFEEKNYQLIQDRPIYLKVYGEWPAQTGNINYDWKINLSGYVTPFQSWNGSWTRVKLLSNLTGDIIYIPLNYTDFTGAQPDWDDLRFVDLTNTTEYGYFLQKKVDSANATFRIKSLRAESLYIYYDDDLGVSSKSNISNVYDFDETLEGIWFMDERSGTNIPDDSGNDYNGTTTNMENADWMRAKIDYGLDFDGVNESANVGTLGSLGSNLSNGVSLSFWVNTTTTAEGYPFGVVRASGKTEISVVFNAGVGADAGKMRFTIRDEDNTKVGGYTTNDETWNDGNWHHVVMTANGSANLVTIHIDGDSKPISYTAQETPNNFGDLTTGFLIGAFSLFGSPGYFSEAFFDEVAIYNKILNQTNVNQLYNITEPIYVLEEDILDSFPVVTLNTPIDTANLTDLTVILNCTAYDDINLTNVTLYIGEVVNETNVSGVNNTDYLWTRTLVSGDYNWTCKGCDNASQCTTPTIRTFSIKLNITGYVQDAEGTFKSGARVWIINQSDNSTVGHIITNGTGYWTFGPVISGNYFITGYDPANSTLEGDAKPFIVVP